jgi:hypothetical protein
MNSRLGLLLILEDSYATQHRVAILGNYVYRELSRFWDETVFRKSDPVGKYAQSWWVIYARCVD